MRGKRKVACYGSYNVRRFTVVPACKVMAGIRYRRCAGQRRKSAAYSGLCSRAGKRAAVGVESYGILVCSESCIEIMISVE